MRFYTFEFLHHLCGLVVERHHVAIGKFGRILGKLTLVNQVERLAPERLVDPIALKFGSNVILAQVRHRNAQFVAHIAPHGGKNLAVELIALARNSKCLGALEALLRHLAGTLGAHALHIGHFLESLAVIDNHSHQGEQRQHIGKPITHAIDQIGVSFLQIQVAMLELMHIGHGLLAFLVVVRRLPLAFGHTKRHSGNVYRLILRCSGIEVHKLARRQFKSAHILRYHRVGECHISRHIGAIARGVDVTLGVVGVKFLRELHIRSFHILDVTFALHHIVVGGG